MKKNLLFFFVFFFTVVFNVFSQQDTMLGRNINNYRTRPYQGPSNDFSMTEIINPSPFLNHRWDLVRINNVGSDGIITHVLYLSNRLSASNATNLFNEIISILRPLGYRIEESPSSAADRTFVIIRASGESDYYLINWMDNRLWISRSLNSRPLSIMESYYFPQ